MANEPIDFGGRRLRVTLGADVKMRVIEWWEDCWIAFGALTLLAGREGLGKSTIACHWAARETRAGRFVIYLHTEDSREHTVVPRLLAAGADLSKVIFIDVETDTTTEGNVVLPYDNNQLDELIAEYGVGFIVLDAATSAMSANLSGKDDRDVRRFLEPLSQLAAKHNIVILGLVHFGKRDGADSGKLILGSIAWSQVARSVLSVALDPDSGNLVVTNTKGNLAPKTRSVEARIRSTAITIENRHTEIGTLEWLGETTADARDYLSGEGGQSNRDVDDWLTAYLKDGKQKANDVRAAADAEGHTWDQAKRAKKRLGIQAVKDGVWWWELPTMVDGEVISASDEEVKGAEGAPHTRSLAPLLPSRSEGVQECSLDPREQERTSAPLIAPLPRPTVCSVCNIALPATATTDICDDCDDPARKPAEPPVDRPLYVVHDGKARREDARICPYCDKALIYRDDINDGYHTSNSKCVRAHRKLGA